MRDQSSGQILEPLAAYYEAIDAFESLLGAGAVLPSSSMSKGVAGAELASAHALPSRRQRPHPIAAEHTKARPSTEDKHDIGTARKETEGAHAADRATAAEKEVRRGQRQFEQSKEFNQKLDEMFKQAKGAIIAEIQEAKDLQGKALVGSARKAELAIEIQKLEQVEKQIESLARAPEATRLQRLAGALKSETSKTSAILKSAKNKVGLKLITIGGLVLIIGGWVEDARAEGVPAANRGLAKGLMGSSPEPTLIAASTLIELYETIDELAEQEIKHHEGMEKAQQDQFRANQKNAALQTIEAYNRISKEIAVKDPSKINERAVADAIRAYHDKVLAALNSIDPPNLRKNAATRHANSGDAAAAAAGAPGLGDVFRYQFAMAFVLDLAQGPLLDDFKAALMKALNPPDGK